MSHIEKKADLFLERQGYKHRILPENYIDQPPENLDLVKENQKLLERVIKREGNLDEFVQQTTKEVYEMLDVLISEMEYVLGGEWTKLELDLNYSDSDLQNLDSDFQYLLKVKQMDEDIQKRRKEKGEQIPTKFTMSEVVPVAGLVMARFHIYECECNTAIELWNNPPPSENLSSSSSHSSPLPSFLPTPPLSCSSPIIPPVLDRHLKTKRLSSKFFLSNQEFFEETDPTVLVISVNRSSPVAQSVMSPILEQQQQQQQQPEKEEERSQLPPPNSKTSARTKSSLLEFLNPNLTLSDKRKEEESGESGESGESIEGERGVSPLGEGGMSTAETLSMECFTFREEERGEENF